MAKNRRIAASLLALSDGRPVPALPISVQAASSPRARPATHLVRQGEQFAREARTKDQLSHLGPMGQTQTRCP